MKTVVAGRWNRHSSARERAKRLWRLRDKFDKQEVSLEALKTAEDDLIELLIKELDAAGVDFIGDGGIRWDSIYDVSRKIGGCGGFARLTRIPETNHFHRQPVASLPLFLKEPLLFNDLEFVRACTEKPPVMCLPGPYSLARQTQNAETNGLERWARAYAEILNKEIRVLLDAGAGIVRVEEPQILDYPEDFGWFKHLTAELTSGIDRSRAALASWFRPIDNPDYFKLPFGIFFVDFIDGYDTVGILEQFPEDKLLVAGVVDARHTRFESDDEIGLMLQKIAERVPLGRVMLSGSTDFHFLPWDAALEKVKRLVRAARRFSYA